MLSLGMVMELQQPFSGADVKEALNQMHPLKAPGPDGFPALFCQKYWNLVGPDVTTKVLAIYNNGVDLGKVNQTFICLIPKVKVPEVPKDIRPISLSENQSAFIPGRSITDNALVGFEAARKEMVYGFKT